VVYFSEIMFKFSSLTKEEEVYLYCDLIVLDWRYRGPQGIGRNTLCLCLKVLLTIKAAAGG
jgi:hypothetical protein